jgi:molybdopterin guanine dinucleotide-containing S/N-oxide reductase-like protein
MPKVVHAACPHDCPDACGALITVDELSGRATKIQGDPSHPVTRGFLCAKVAKYLDRVYSPDRLLYPMRRVAPKGKQLSPEQAFQRISWDEALDEIVSHLKSIANEFGPESILPYSYGGTLGQLNNASMDMRFFHQLDRTICATAGAEALISVYGKKIGTEPEQFRKSKYIIAWGANIHGNNIHLWPFIEEARRDGAKLIVLDPYRTRTARCADWHIAINPGTDVVLAMAMMRVIISEGLHDADYISKNVLGFDELRARMNEETYSPDNAAKITGIPAHDIVRLAREYATTRPAVIRLNYGAQRSENGGMNIRAVAMLPALIGSWKEIGGGLQLSTSGGFPLNKSSLHRLDLMGKSLGRPARVINMSALGQALNKANDPPVKAVFVYNSNPAAVAPNHNAVVRGFMRPDLFTVVHEQFFTDTTDYADIVLPATTFFEHKELQTSYGHYYLQVSHAAIAPLGESRSNVDVFRELGQRFGFEDECFRETVDDMIDGALKTDHAWMQGITRERLEREGHVRLNVEAAIGEFLPFASGPFDTQSGKIEFYSQSLKEKGLDPVLAWVPPAESRHAEKSKRYPLEMLARKADNHLNSTFCNLPSHQKMEEPHLLEIHTADAAKRGIHEGDAVRVFNDRGEITLKARVDGAVQRGVVATRLNWAKLHPTGKNVNVLTAENLTELGGGATFYSCLVEVERAGD